MLATILISAFTLLIIAGLLAALFIAARDARQGRSPTAGDNTPPEPPHPLAWLLYLLLALMFAGIGAWHLAHPDELMGGSKWVTVALGLAYLALGQYGPGIAALAVATGFFVACVRHLRAQG